MFSVPLTPVRRRRPLRFDLLPAALVLALLAWNSAGRQAHAYPINSIFTINSANSNLKLRAEALSFDDDDTKSLTGSLNVTLDLGVGGFGTPAKFTVNSGTVTPSGSYNLTLGFPPILGVKAVAANLAAQVSTPNPPGTMVRSASPGVVYNIDASQFLVRMNQGTVTVTGSANETIDLAAEPVEGTSPAGTTGTLTLTTGATNGYFTRINAALSLPVDVSETTDLGGISADIQVTGTVNATSAFYVALSGIPGDFQLDGDVDAADLMLWKNGYGLAAGATTSNGDADANGSVDGADFLLWQRNLGVTPPVAATQNVSAVPEPRAMGACVVALSAFVAVRRKGCAGAR